MHPADPKHIWYATGALYQKPLCETGHGSVAHATSAMQQHGVLSPLGVSMRHVLHCTAVAAKPAHAMLPQLLKRHVLCCHSCQSGMNHAVTAAKVACAVLQWLPKQHAP